MMRIETHPFFFNDHLSNFHQIANRNQENYQQHCKQKHMAFFFQEHVKSSVVYAQIICIFTCIFAVQFLYKGIALRCCLRSNQSRDHTYLYLVRNLLFRLTMQNMFKTNAAYSSSDSIVAVPVVFPATSLTAH